MNKPEDFPGMGAIPAKNGTSFRVWAPHADKVFITGSFNKWEKEQYPLQSIGNGYWFTFLKEAKAGDEYKYLIKNGDKTLIKNDPRAMQLTDSTGNSLIMSRNFNWEGDSYNLPPWNELVQYEMHIGTFNVKEKGKTGTFYSAIEKFEHLEAMGINVIELMPITEFPGDFSWGYNGSHLYAVESSYGGVEGLKNFVKEAHKRGMAVIQDVVWNHVGPNDTDLWQFDGWSENDMGGIYFYNDRRAETPWGHTRPDYSRDEVRQFLRDNAMYWLEEYHMDGYRVDGTLFIRNVTGFEDTPENELPDGWSFLQWVNKDIRSNYFNKLIIAEDIRDNAFITKPEEEGGAGFGTQWDAAFVNIVRRELKQIDDNVRDISKIADMVQRSIDGNAFTRIIYTESHDDVANGKARLAEEIDPGRAKSYFARQKTLLGMVLVLTSKGIPQLFQGQEFLEDKWFDDKDPIDWGLVKKHKGYIQACGDLIRIRRNFKQTTKGLTGDNLHVFHVDNENKVLAFQRFYEGGPKDTTLVIINFKNLKFDGYKIGFPEEGRWVVRFNSDWEGYDPDNTGTYALFIDTKPEGEDGFPFSGLFDIGPYSALILSRD